MTSAEFQLKGSYLGQVHVSKNEPCSVYISVEGVFSKSTLMEYRSVFPVNLERKFQKDGSYIRFNYNLSRAKSPEGCQVDAVVSVTEVEKSKSTEGFKAQ